MNVMLNIKRGTDHSVVLLASILSWPFDCEYLFLLLLVFLRNELGFRRREGIGSFPYVRGACGSVFPVITSVESFKYKQISNEYIELAS